MTFSTFIALVPALLGVATLQGGSSTTVRRLVIQDQVILRVPVQPQLRLPIRWVEKKGPKCVRINEIRAAMLSNPEQVDFLLRNRRRVRAQLSRGCAALDFYSGFYLKTEDERMCADRDVIHSRMGGSCEIDEFRALIPTVER